MAYQILLYRTDSFETHPYQKMITYDFPILIDENIPPITDSPTSHGVLCVISRAANSKNCLTLKMWKSRTIRFCKFDGSSLIMALVISLTPSQFGIRITQYVISAKILGKFVLTNIRLVINGLLSNRNFRSYPLSFRCVNFFFTCLGLFVTASLSGTAVWFPNPLM